MKILDRVLPPNSNEYETPPAFYNRLHLEFDFTLDAFASRDNTLCADYYSEHVSAFTHRWVKPDESPHTVFANPPYSQTILGKAVTRMANQSMSAGCTVVGLVPPSTDTKWWHDIVMRYASEVRLVQGRISFMWNDKPLKGNRGQSAVIVFRHGVYGPVFTSMAAEV